MNLVLHLVQQRVVRAGGVKDSYLDRDLEPERQHQEVFIQEHGSERRTDIGETHRCTDALNPPRIYGFFFVNQILWKPRSATYFRFFLFMHYILLSWGNKFIFLMKT